MTQSGCEGRHHCRRRCGAPRLRRDRGQVLAEFSLALPVFVVLIFGMVDVSRYAYTMAKLTQSAQTAARLLTVPDNQNTDCAAQAVLASSGNWANISIDSNSYAGDGDPAVGSGRQPTPAAAIPPDSGRAYIYPAVAQPTAASCVGAAGTRPSGSNVTVQITYVFRPITPVLGGVAGTLKMTVTAVDGTEY